MAEFITDPTPFVLDASWFARKICDANFRDQAWLQFTTVRGDLVVRGQFTGWYSKDWQEFREVGFPLPLTLIRRLAEAFPE